MAGPGERTLAEVRADAEALLREVTELPAPGADFVARVAALAEKHGPRVAELAVRLALRAAGVPL